MVSIQSHRKDEHLSLAKKFHKTTSTAGFDQIRFIPNTLPEISFADVDISTKLGELTFDIPFYIEAMTGGSEYTGKINQQLATIANNLDLAMAVGSESVALREPKLADTFETIKATNPNGFKIANLSASATIADVQTAIEMIDASAIEIHVNVAQEVVMPEGDRHFNWIDNIKKIVNHFNIPVIVKEVGFGMSHESIERLKAIGVQYINLGGKGGTNFVQIENFRRPNKDMSYLEDWGLTTVESLYEAKSVSNINIAAAGGITTPLDIVKALYLGADVVGVASTILSSLIDNGAEKTEEILSEWIYGIKAIFVMLGVRNITELRKTDIVIDSELQNYLEQRNIK
ncbi:type 2 isopentenyl-diphosphate Delta-isomerase [Fructilactobacillus sp. Tb1]|uniref:type 2 isopentenyl-diphosphate Delta-isomerase n=1 Tax=Fructilactobacillus sp. Tb1 TaxID=3422304 RepID=UPI003D2845BE